MHFFPHFVPLFPIALLGGAEGGSTAEKIDIFIICIIFVYTQFFFRTINPLGIEWLTRSSLLSSGLNMGLTRLFPRAVSDVLFRGCLGKKLGFNRPDWASAY